jgi:hypothetical protein
MTGHYDIAEHPAKKFLFVSPAERKKKFDLAQVLKFGKALSLWASPELSLHLAPPGMQPHADKTLSRGPLKL